VDDIFIFLSLGAKILILLQEEPLFVIISPFFDKIQGFTFLFFYLSEVQTKIRLSAKG